MQVKKFEASTLQEALDRVKKELGPEAIILQTKKNRKGFLSSARSMIEITATISDRELKRKNSLESRLGKKEKDSYQQLSAFQQAQILKKYQAQKETKTIVPSDSFLEHSVEFDESKKETRNVLQNKKYIDILDEEQSTSSPPLSQLPPLFQPGSPDLFLSEEHYKLKEEVASLKKMLGADSHWPSFVLQYPIFQDFFDQLILAGMDRRYAVSLLKKISFDLDLKDKERSSFPQISDSIMSALAHEMMESIQTTSLFQLRLPTGRPTIFSWIGPTGVGKTSLIAKIAGQWKQKKVKIGLLSFRTTFIPGETDLLALYSKILHLPFRSASTLTDLRSALSDFYSLDFIFLDTGGFSQKNQDWMQNLKKDLLGIPEIQFYLVLSSSTRDVEQIDMSSRFSCFRPLGMAITKLDESLLYGGIYNLFQKNKLPLVYFSTGQKIPDDLEEATSERLVSLILDL